MALSKSSVKSRIDRFNREQFCLSEALCLLGKGQGCPLGIPVSLTYLLSSTRSKTSHGVLECDRPDAPVSVFSINDAHAQKHIASRIDTGVILPGSGTKLHHRSVHFS